MATSVHSFEFLLEWDHAGTTWYFSRFGEITVDGHVYTPRMVDVPAVGGVYIDRTYADWQDASFRLDNLDDDWGQDFFFTARDAEDEFEDDEVRFSVIDRAGGDPFELFTGLVKRPTFGRSDFTCTFDATFPVNAVEIQVPTWTLGKRCHAFYNGSLTETAGGTIPSAICTWTEATGLNPEFPEAQEGSCDHGRKTPNGCAAHNNLQDFGGLTHIAKVTNGEPNNTLDREDVREAVAPIVIGDGDFKIRPVIYRADLDSNLLTVNGIISSCHPGLPFDAEQFEPERFRLWGEIRAASVEIYYGDQPQAIPGSRTLFPEEAGHSLWCYFAARFELTPEQADRAEQDSLKRDVVVKLAGGRPTLRSGGRTQNPVYANEDVLRDRANGLGWPSSKIDESSITSAASYVGTRFRGRYEWDRSKSVMDWLQEDLGSWHGYLFYEGGKLGYGAKRHNETAAAVFGTGGYSIDRLEPTQKDYAELVTGALFKYRDEKRQGHKIPRRDPGAQQKGANGGLVKPEWEKVFLHGLFDETEAQISSAIWMREEINLNYFAAFRTPLPDWIDAGVRCGQVIRLNDPLIADNSTNYLFRIIGWSLEPSTYEVRVETQIYDGAVYGYNTDELGDIIRDGAEPSTGGKPPDVENVEASIVDVYLDEGDPSNDDDDTEMVRIECSAEYPDLSAEMDEDHEDGLATEYPIVGFRLFHRFTDESAIVFKPGPIVRYPETIGHLEVPFHKRRSLEVLFAAIGRNNATGQVGYVLDPTRTSYLDENVDATEIAIDVDDGAPFADGDFVRCESEIMKIAASGVAGDTLTMEASGGNRAPQLKTTALEHARGTEIGVAKLSHPSVIVDMTARRYTLAQVTGVVSRSRPRGVRVKWVNLTDYDNEKYFLFWSVTGALDDLDAWVASWTSQNPKGALPAGVYLIKCGKKAHVLIPQEDIDAAYGSDASGVAVQVRVAAKIKNNYSSALSALPGSSPGHHNRPWEPPADPLSGDIHQERVGTSDRVRVWVDVYATEDRLVGTPRTFEEVNTHEIIAVWNKWDKQAGDWEDDNRPAAEAVEDPTAVFQVIERTFHRGARYRLRRLKARNPGTKSVATATVDIEINVGDETDEIDAIIDLAIAPFGTDEDTESIELDGNGSQLLVSFTNSTPGVSLRELQVRKRKTGVSKWRRSPAVQLLDRVDDNGVPFTDPGIHELRVDVHHPRGVTMDFEVRLVGADGDETAWSGINRSTTNDAGDLPIRSDANGPNYPSGPGAAWATTGVAAGLHRNHVVADGAKLQVEAAFQLLMDGTAGDQDFESPDAGYGPIRSATIVLQKRNAAGSANEGDPLRIDAGIDPTKGSSAQPHYAGARLEAGAIYDWIDTIFKNSSGKLIRSTPPDGARFLAGRGSHQFDATAIVTASLTRTDATNNRNAKLSLVFTQPATPVLLKRAVVEVSYNQSAGGAATWEKAGSENLLDDFLYVSATSGSKTIPLEATHKKNQSDMGFRVILVPVNSNYGTTGSGSPNKVVTTSGAHTAADEANNPTSAAAAPTILKATIGPGGLTARCSKPADARPYLQRYDYQFANATSGGSVDWLDPDFGTIALLNTNPTAGDVALAAATFASDHRFTASDTQKRDLDVAFKNGTAQGVLALHVRARIVDLDGSGAIRVGAWSGFEAVEHRRNVDGDSDVRNVGTGNLVDGGNCDTDSSQYSPAAGGTTTIGRHMALAPSGAGTRITTATSKIFWDKTRRCVSINNTNNSNQLCIRLYGVLTPEQIFWLTFAIRGQASAFNPGTIVAALYDAGGAGSTKASVSINRTLSNGTYDLIGVKFDLTGVSAWTGNPWLIFDPPNTWTSGIIDITRIKLAPGPTPTLFERGAQEVGLDASSGVGLGDIGGLAALERNVSLQVEGITTWGVLATV